MKKKNLIQKLMLILSFCVISQVINAQTTCSGNKVLMNDRHCCIKGGCHTKCVSSGQVQQYINMGWVYGICTCSPCFRLGVEEENDNTSLIIYPNPVSTSATISFVMEKSEKVSFKLFDMNARLISAVADKVFEAGENEIEWNAAEVNAGIYFLQFQSVGFSQMKKLIVTK